LSITSVFTAAWDDAHSAWQLLQSWARCYPRWVVALGASMVLGTGATAFAVASWVPDPRAMAVREVREQIEPPKRAAISTSAQEALAPFVLYRSDQTRSNDTADSLLRRMGVLDASAVQFIRTDATARQSLLSRAGRSVRVEVDAHHALVKLSARWILNDSRYFERLVIERQGDQFQSRIETAPLQASIRLGSGTIESSLFAATDEARIPDAIAMELAEIFSGDIDFHRALRKGDRFSVVYESLEADGEPLRTGRVQSAEFVNNGISRSAVWFEEPNAKQEGRKGAYYTLEGNSFRKAFLASPLAFSRVTSGFGGRIHPIAKQFRMHNGIDYAAPTGTPIRTIGDGVVTFSGVQRGYGNVVEIMHRDGKSTLYAHMHEIGVRKGQHVSQGQLIGTVGSTGWSTGPHLHFEFRIHGVHHDPRLLVQQNETVLLNAASRPQFDALAARVRRDLNLAATLTPARAQ
jgi:murein DD-endopeptidase MepM/ murein hydrolase activator NlpD